MHCPFCNHTETKVIDSRLVGEGNQIRRRRECLQCQDRFTTYESAELTMPKVIKRDGRRKPFDESKLRQGMARALEKRPVSTEVIEGVINHIKHRLRATGEREVKSDFIGECIMHELRQLDDVAYVRFASVYRSFQDLNAFSAEIENLQTQHEPTQKQ